MGREGRCAFTKSCRLASPHSHCHSKHPSKVTRPAVMHHQCLHAYSQTCTAKRDRHLDLVFVVSRKLSALKRRPGGRTMSLCCLGITSQKEKKSDRDSMEHGQSWR